MAGIRLQRFGAAATVVVCGCIVLALTPAAIVPGSAGVVITIILLVMQGLALTVPNVLVHLTRRLTVHHCGHSREVRYTVATGEAALRQRICAAFKDQATIEPAAIEGLEHPRGSGVVYPLSLVAAAVDSLLGSDCDLALLRPEPSVTRFRWEDLQTGCSLSPEQLQQQQDFARCLAAMGYCMIRMPRERLEAPAAVFDQVWLLLLRTLDACAGHSEQPVAAAGVYAHRQSIFSVNLLLQRRGIATAPRLMS